ncbi:SDR family NAD(P)-dependent oxidoreductase [Saccharopolyspora indica]|uniref:type I polyketide synthase n=1 Tax=Saccharopolyspora indica TaxID=1229659 RepID=UPI0022EB5E68|nr:type I polyketide synthase [Saccharopolyspora indica]MDA3647918.1 SDR family NAD(P)-dependent oxidoreductase [Saccharopolyspora indica]
MLRSELIRPLPELLRAHALRRGEKVAFADADRSVTYADLERRTARLAGHLVAAGLPRGARILIWLNNSVEAIEGYLTAVRAGGVGVPVHPRTSADELEHLLRDSGARAVLTDAAHLPQLREVTAGRADLVVVATGAADEAVLSFEELAESEPAQAARDDLGLDDLAWMLYTSGTTGRPKGVLSTQGNCLWSVAACYAPVLGLRSDDHVLWPLPLSHSLAHVLCLHGVIAVGATARIAEGFTSDEVVELLRREPVTFLVGVPTMYHDLLAAARSTGLDAYALRTCMVTGAVTSATLSTSFEDTFGVRLIDSYGSTETSGAITMNRPNGAVVPGSCGLPVPGLDIRIADVETGAELPPGVEGEVWVSGPNVMAGYHGQPDATAAALVDGWYRTGDLAVRDGLGYLTITGRIKELIIRGGENIHPAEIEEVVRAVPGLVDVAVAGRPHETLGEVPVAFVVAERTGEVDVDRIIATCRERLAYFKVPAEVYEVTAIPRTTSGKVARRRLLDLPARLHTGSEQLHELLHRIDWVPVPGGPDEIAGSQRWAVVGEDDLGLPAEVRRCPDLTAIGPDVPDVLIARADEQLLAAWSGDDRFAATRLVLVTEGAVSVRGEAPDLLQAPFWGLARAAGDDRVISVDVGEATGGELVSAVRSGEPRSAIRDGILRAPRPSRVRSASADVLTAADAVLVIGDAGDLGLDGRVLRCGIDDAAEVLARERVSAVVFAGGGDPRSAVDGALRLHELTEDLDLRAFVLLSTADPSRDPDRAAANALLGALAQHRRALGLAGTSLAWGKLPASERSALFRLALATGEPLLIAGEVDDADPAGEARPTAGAPGLRHRIARLPVAEQQRRLVDLVRAEAAGVLGLADTARLPGTRAFKELGFDSKTAVELRNRVVAATGIALPPTVVFDRPTPAALAELLRTELIGGTARAQVRAEGAVDEPIAIVGMSCRLPGGVNSPEDLWQLLADSAEALSDFPADRGWDLDGLFADDPDTPGTSYVRRGGFLPGAAEFDADFFGISPREALAMDPQQRLLLETSWEAFERAGIDPTSVRGSRTGVFVGVMFHDYAARAEQLPEGVEGYLGIGSAGSVASGRIAYTLGLEGPAVTIDTACSSSLVALHQASSALRSGECSLALAGGVAVMATPSVFVEFSRQRGLAPDGRCKPFAASADGTGWSEGAGLLVLERLSDARRNGHEVLAVLRGSAVNQDGASNGLTAPNGQAQERVIRQALANAALHPSEVDAVEAHGTGTALGDPIEAGALLATYGQDREHPLLLGSVKSNIGHTQAASGVTGVIKMVLSMRHGVLPKTLHLDSPTPHVDWSAGKAELLTSAVDWPETGRPRRAGVSSFGVSGTNAHVIVEQPPQQDEPAPEAASAPVPWLLSARSEAALRDTAERLLPLVDSPVGVGRALATTRAALEHRAVVVGSDPAELAAGLRAVVDGDQPAGLADVEGQPVFVFPGQGSQWAGMALELLDSEPEFAAAWRDCAAAVEAHADWSATDALRGPLDRVDVVQPVLFAVLVSLARLWRAHGVEPAAVVGHSQGEIAAACVSGALSLDDAAKAVVLRSRLIGETLTGRGGMVSVALPAAEVRDLISRWGGQISVAAVNGPSATVVSGEPGALAELTALSEVRTKTIPVDYASHSAQVEGIRDRLLAELSSIAPREPGIPFFSTVTGDWIDGPVLDAEYWYTNLRRPVLFEDAIRALAEQGHRAFIETSPHPVLTASIEEVVVDGAVLGTLRRDEGGLRRFRTALGDAHVRGIAVDWSVTFGASDRRVALPTYPFQRQRFWLSSAARGDATALGLGASDHPLLGAVVRPAEGDGLVLTGRLSATAQPWLADHVVLDQVIAPGSLFAELAVRAGDEVGNPHLRELTLQAPLILAGEVQVQVVVGPDGQSVSIHSRQCPEDPWTRHAAGVLADSGETEPTALQAWPPPGAEQIPIADLYAGLADSGLRYGPAFQGVTAAWRRAGEVFAEVRLPDEIAADAGGFGVHPALLDAALHAADLGVLEPGERKLAFAWSGVELHATGATALRVRLAAAGADEISLLAADESGAPVLSVRSLAFRAPEAGRARAVHRDSLFRVAWQPLAAPDAAPGNWAVVGADELRLGDWLAATGAQVDHVAALPEISAGVPDAVVITCPAGDAREVLHDVTALLRSWLGDDRFAESHLILVTRRAVAVDGESPALDQAAIWGLVRSAQSEHPGRISLVDVDGEDGCWVGLSAPSATGEPQIAVRAGRVLVPRLERVVAEDRLELPTGGTVLVTGATGGLGRLVARHLVAEHGVRRLLLLSRRGEDEELAGLDAEITFAACDVADREALAGVLAEIPAEHPLTAVVHTAGVVDDGLADSLGDEQFDRVLRPKADGAWHLHELTEDLDLAAFVLFSSAATTFGAPGQGNYAAANAFLDALAQHRRSQGLPAVSLAWGLWAEEGGMGGRLSEADRTRMKRGGTVAMPAEEALGLFDAAAALDHPALVPVHLDVKALRRGEIPALLRDLVPAPSRRVADSGARDTTLGALPGDQLRTVLSGLIGKHVAAVLGHAPGTALEETRSFKELGFDSLTAVELRNRLNRATGLRLPPTVIFNYPTSAALTEHLAAELGGGAAPARPAEPARTAEVADDPIAIVALSCRYPGGIDSPEALWRVVAEEQDTIGPVPADRGWDLEGLYDPDPDQPGKTYLLEGGFLTGLGDFDAEFFGINPREALAMDPQQRLLLETAWEAFERAGIDPATLRGQQVGVFTGTHGQDYGALLVGAPPDLEGYRATGTAGSVFSGRLSYTFGLEGPAVTVDTACSASLVALHQAVLALRNGECGMALVGAASVMSTPDPFVTFSRQRVLATDGRCKAFSAAANGTGMAEGVGMLLVERLSDAQRAGRQVLAVIRGSAVNQDGASNGLTAPNGPAQERVIRQALASAGLAGRDVDVVEAHGTGTALGDPIEAQAVLATYGADRDDPVWLGSVKSNLGHTQSAAGIAGVIKMVMAMRHGVLPRTLHVDDVSPNVDWSAGSARVLAEARPWVADRHPRRAGISAFGISGTNAHVIIEQPAAVDGEAPGAPEPAGRLPLVLSAKSEGALQAQASRLLDHLAADTDLIDLGFSAATTRTAFAHRAAVLGTTGEEFRAGLAALADGASAPNLVRGTAAEQRKVALVFPGQGSQWPEMAGHLLAESPVFADRLGECEEALRPFVPWSLHDALRGAPGAPELDRLSVVQPVLFSVMVSLAEVWRAHGVRPTAVVGHSQGEVAAACVAGALSLPDAARVVAIRSRLIDSELSGRGGVVSVALPATEVAPRLERWGDRLSLAAVNGPAAVAVAGEPAALDELMAELEAEDVRARRIRGAHAAGHTAQVEVLREQLLAELAGIAPRESELAVYSTVAGGRIESATMDAEYWYRNAREPVLFEPAVRALAEDGYGAFIESSPHPVLASAIQESVEGTAVVGTLRRDEGDRFPTSLAEAFVRGIAPDWSAVFPETARRVELPTYAFQRKTFWPTTQSGGGSVAAAGLSDTGHPLLGAAVAVPEVGLLLTGRLAARGQDWLAGTVPTATFVELALRAGAEVGCDRLVELTAHSPVELSGQGSVDVQVLVGERDDQGRHAVTVRSRSGAEQEWVRRAGGILAAGSGPAPGIGTWPPEGAAEVDGMPGTWQRGEELFAETELPEGDAEDYELHPVLLDNAVLAAGLDTPTHWQDVRLHATGASRLRVRLTRPDPESVALTAVDGTGAPVVSIGKVEARPFDTGAAPTRHHDALFRVEWPEVAVDSTAPSGHWVALGEDCAGLPALQEAIAAGGQVPEFVSVSLEPGDEREPVAAAAARTGATLDLLQTWLADDQLRSARLVVLTREAISTRAGDGGPDLAQAPTWGLVRAAQSENPDRFILVDVDAHEASHRQVPAAVATGEPQVAIRAGIVRAPRLARAAAPTEPTGLKTDGTALITGGTGALGRLLARHLVVEHGVRHLLLTSRRGGADDLVAELAEHGASVTVAACDVADRAALAAQLADIPAEHPLTCVVHAAGVIDDALISSLTSEQLDAVLRPKVAGAVNLHELTAELDLDAFVLFSSGAATFGAPGQGNYAAANAFLDALAHQRRAAGLPAVSLAWGLWSDRSGSARQLTDVDLRRMSRSGTREMTAELGLALFDAAIGVDDAFLVPTKLDFAALRGQARAGDLPALFRGLVRVPARRTAAGTSSLATEIAGRTAAAQRELVLDLVRGNAASVLGHSDVDAVGAGRAFRELGFDSLTAVELRNRLQTATGLTLPATLVFDHPTPDAVTERLLDLLLGRTRTSGEPVAAVASAEPIAVVAIGCRYPGGVRSPEDFWELLADGRDAIGGLPTDRGWALDELYHPDPDVPGRSYVRGGGFLPDAAEFDAAFFGISPREATAMDPQQRLVLEVSWEALERAGIDPLSLRGSRTGIFTGTSGQDYAALAARVPDADQGYLVTSTGASVLSGRVSYTLGLEGPAMTVDTACSSSLVAIHLAAQALRNGECSLALAGGAAVLATPQTLIAASRQRGLSPDGRCKAFSEGADGFGMAEGAGMLVLERLSDAQRHGHPVLAVLRGSAVNQDGASNGLTAPNGPSQERVIRQALANAGLATGEVDAVEAHGTGTRLGDPIEAQALLATYGQDRERPVWLGSVKSNIGHTLGAAGVAGVIKMVLAVRNGLLPRTLHAEQPTSEVDWTAGDVRLLEAATPWPETGAPRRAGISSFGISGTNAHAIVEQAPAAPEAGAGRADLGPVVLSARSAAALSGQADRLRSFVAADPDLDLAGLGFSLATTRAALEHRAAIVAADRDELLHGLEALAGNGVAANLVRGTARDGLKTAFVFSGQGSQRAGMGRELHAAHPVFAAAFDEVCARLDAHLDGHVAQRVRDVVFADAPGGDLLDQTLFAQTGLFAFQVALFRLLEHWGLAPDFVLGHSIGELAAAHVAGVLDLPDACALVAARARLMQALPTGAMVSVQAPEAEVAALLTEQVSIAAVNGPRSTVISGEEDAVLALADDLAAAGFTTRRLRVSHAFHSPLMDGMLDDFAKVAEGLTYHPPAAPIVSNLTGEPVESTTAEYWVRHVRHAVRFADGIRWLADHGAGALLELGPSGVSTAMARDCVGDEVVLVPASRKDRPEVAALLSAVGRLHVSGRSPDWTAIFGAARRIDLPTYAFQRQRYWLDAPGAEESSVDEWRYRESWEPLPAASGELDGRWLVVVPPGPEDESWAADALERAGATPVVLALTGAEDRAQLAERIGAVGALDGVLSLLGLDDRPLPDHPSASAGLARTALLLQATADAGVEAPLWCATRSAVSTGDADREVDPIAAQLWGFGRVAALEYPARWGGLVDLPADVDGSSSALTAVLSGRTGEDQIAVRGTAVLGRRLVRDPIGTTSATWQPTGTVLITGGTGALGGHVARRLAQAGADHLLLASRRGPAAPGADALAAELRELGAEVSVAACDMADRDSVAELLASVPAEHPLTAVVHTAGVVADGIIDSMTPERIEEVMRPKADAAWHLHELTKDLGLSAFVLYAAMAGAVGSPGQGNYAAANTFLDALAELRRAQGLPATSISWGWWEGEGMAELDGVDHTRLRRNGLLPMAPQRAVRALEQAIDHGDATLLITNVDWDAFVPNFTTSRGSRLLSALAAPAPEAAGSTAPDLAQQLIGAAPDERDRIVLDVVCAHVAEVLGYGAADTVEVDRGFLELGFDSLTAVELRNQLVGRTGLQLPSTLIFDYPTPAALAARLGEELAAQPGADPREAEVRALLATIPLNRLADAGLLDVLLGLGPARPSDGEDVAGAIDELDASDLVRMARETLDS